MTRLAVWCAIARIALSLGLIAYAVWGDSRVAMTILLVLITFGVEGAALAARRIEAAVEIMPRLFADALRASKVLAKKEAQ